jgi:hypothetical protein
MNRYIKYIIQNGIAKALVHEYRQKIRHIMKQYNYKGLSDY